MKLILNNLLRKSRLPLAALIVAGAGLIAWRMTDTGKKDPGPAVFEVQRGPLTISVTESGTIQSRDKIILRSEVEGRNTILWIVEEGRAVKPGDLLVELDASKLEEARLDQIMRVENTEAALVQSRENLEIVRSENASAIEAAEMASLFAVIDLEKYRDGEYPGMVQQIEADIAIAEEELQRAQDRLAWSLKLEEGGHITRTELQADEIALKRKRLDLELARGRLNLLKVFTHRQRLQRLLADGNQSTAALERTRRRTAASLLRAESDLRTRESEVEKQKARLNKLATQIAKCRIVAPTEGIVVYATSVRRRGSGEPLQAGQDVVERQELIHLPATTEMMAEIKVPESNLAKVNLGVRARIQVDALPGRIFAGRLARIGILPDASDAWLNPNLKMFNGEVHLTEVSPLLRSGMSCRVELVIEEHEHVVYLPIQAVTRVDGRSRVYVLDSRGDIEPRDVETGLDNNRMMVIHAGVTAGEKVLLDPPLPLSEASQTSNGTAGLGASVTNPAAQAGGASTP